MDRLGTVNGLVIDGADTHALAAFWSAVLGTEIDSVEGDGHYIDLRGDEGTPVLRFQRVPESKSGKNRLHLDIEVADVDAGVARVRDLGGTSLGPVRREYGWDYAVVADVEGNEFCLIAPSEGP